MTTQRTDLNIPPATKPSEVIANALAFWGEHGEGWVRGALFSYRDSKGCLYGGLEAGFVGVINGRAYKYNIDTTNQAIYNKATSFVLDELESRGKTRDIIYFNDFTADSFQDVRSVACGALKRALAVEEAEELKEGKSRNAQ